MTAKPMMINGAPFVGSGAPLPVTNPATGEALTSVSTATPDEVAQAVESAKAAAADPGWRDMLPHLRARLLERIAAGIEARVEDFARAQMLENGKPIAECRTQAKSAAATFRYYASVVETQGGEVTPPRGDFIAMTTYEPYGVVAAITPWNSPLTMEAQKVAPALAAGNAVVLKPSEVTPSPGLLLAEVALEAGLAPGLLNVVSGTGAIVGDALIRHPDVRMISFTGGTESGRRIAGVAAERLIPAALELGGKSPHVVFADADLDAAAAEVAGGIFEGSGQSCVAGSRLFVERAVFDTVVEKVVAHARALTLGLPTDENVTMGSIASHPHRDRIAALVDQAKAEGATVVTGGVAPAALDPGAYYEPTVLTDLGPDDMICQTEIFGPVLCALPFDNEDDLVAQANNTAFGLAAGIWTRDYQRAWRVARRIEAGTVWINTYKKLSIATPFGGFKDSGLGREKGIGGMRLYQQSKSIVWGL